MLKTYQWPFSAFLLYALAYFALLYHPGMLRYDDFGYLQSVIETIIRGRPFTHDWLAPYTASSSSLAAWTYSLTGNFPLSTWGLQSLFVLANFLLLMRLLRINLSWRDSSCMGLVIATQPIYWYKCSEFGGNTFTFSFVMAALIAYHQRRWIWFFGLVFIAFANRQNSIALLALPIYHLIFERAGTNKKMLVGGLILFLFSSVLLHLNLNRSYAQMHSIYSTVDSESILNIGKSILVGFFLALSFLSLFQALLGSRVWINFQTNYRNPWTPGIATALFLLLYLFGVQPLVDFQAPFIGSLDHAGQIQYLLLAVIPVLLWVLNWKSLRFNVWLCLAGSYIIITSMRGFWFDIYLLDIGLVVFIYSLSQESPQALTRATFPVLLVSLLAHLFWGYGYKIMCDKNLLSNQVYENLEREGRVDVENMTDATFGYDGWKLFDYSRVNEPFTNFGAFLRHIRMERVVIDTELPWRRKFKRKVQPGSEILKEGMARIGFLSLRYRVMDLHSDREESIGIGSRLSIDKEKYHKKSYPLNRQEWTQYISALKSGQEFILKN